MASRGSLTTCAALAAALSALATAGCLGGTSEAGEAAPPPPPRADAHVTCERRAEPPPPEDGLRDGGETHVGRAELPGGGRFEVATFGDAGPTRIRSGRRRVWLWKTPAALTADRSVVVTVGRGQRRRVRLGFDRGARTFAEASRATRFTSCPADEPRFSGPGVVGPWTGWGGSLMTVERRVCLRLRVFASGTSSVLRLPLGRRCA